MSSQNIHPVLLDSPEAVDRRFDMIPKTGVSVRVSTRELQMYYVAIEYLEQLVENVTSRQINITKARLIAEHILLKLPIISI